MSKVWVFQGDALSVLQSLPDECIHCCVTSPPYYGLRDYGTATWEGGDPNCTHDVRRWEGPKQTQGAQSGHAAHRDRLDRQECACGARRVDLQIGLEKDLSEYITKLVNVLGEVRRVLRSDGTLWLNLGDSFFGGAGSSSRRSKDATGVKRPAVTKHCERCGNEFEGTGKRRFCSAFCGGIDNSPRADRGPYYFKPKDLMGMPWRVAFALQDDGWYLRSEIIWAKNNVMPESVSDRPTRNHEYIFLMTKSPNYFYDKEAIKEEGVIPAGTKGAKGSKERYETPGVNSRPPEYKVYDGKRNRRSVWVINTKPFPAAHFATFPPALAEVPLLAGTSEHGCCAVCGSPYKRIVKPTAEYAQHLGKDWANYEQDEAEGRGHFQKEDGTRSSQRCVKRNAPSLTASYETVGWEPGCQCEAEVVPCTILDPFAGSGTVGEVAIKHGRNAVLIELSPDYIKLIEDRVGRENIASK